MCRTRSSRSVVLAVCLAAAAAAGAQGAQDSIPAGDWSFDALGLVYRDAGLAPMPVVAPMTRAELGALVDAIDPSRLSEQGLELYDRLAELGRSSGKPGLSLRAGLSVGMDARCRSDESMAWSGAPADRPSLIKAPIAVDLGDAATGFADLELREGYWASVLPSDELDGRRNWTGIPDGWDYIDTGIPRRAGLSVGGDCWSFMLARDRIDLGAEDLGATTVSRYLDRVDFARLSFFSESFSWRSIVIQLQGRPVTLDTDDGTQASSVSRYIYLHRADWRPSGKLSLGFTEGVLVAQPMELRFLNPFMSFHAMSAWKNYGDAEDSVGSLLGLDVCWAPIRGARAYGQVAANQIKTPFPSEAGSLQPDAYALLGGFEWAVPYKKGFFQAKLEGYYAAPWFATLYGRDWCYLSLRRELVAPEGHAWSKGDILSWLGSPYGRDAAVAKLEAAYLSPGAWKASVEYRLAALGERSLDSGDTWDGDWYPGDGWQDEEKNSRIRAPSGTPIFEHALSFSGSLKSGAWNFGGLVALKLRLNDEHAKGERAAGVEATLSVERRIY
jgi:hypothetical protein